MRAFASRLRSAACCLVLVALATAAGARAQATGHPAAGALIDVPYFAQTPLLCGGAALTMVLRYWGAEDVVPADFQALVDESAGGITTGRLVDAAETRGWTAVPTSAAATEPITALARHVQQGRPVVALIEDRPGVHHYVVVVGVTDSAVVLHDPARAPYQVVSHEAFDTRWQVSSRWMLLVLPNGTARAEGPAEAGIAPVDVVTASSAPSEATSVSPCESLVARGIDAARDDHATAERILRTAVALCPASGAALRELSGLRFVQQQWHDSAALAAQAVRRDAADQHAWRLLATSRFLAEDRAGALQAWNVTGEPIIDRVVIEGLRRTPQALVGDLAGLEPGLVLTRARFLRAARRLEDYPTASRTTLAYSPVRSGRTTVSAAVRERPVLPSGWMNWSAVTVESLLTRTLRVNISAPLGQGDLWQPSFRWPRERRRTGVAFSLPVPGGRRGLIHVDAFGERQTYARALEGLDRTEETRRRVAVSWSDWVTGPLRVEVGGATDRFDTRYFSVFGALTSRLLNDHVATHVRAERWQPRDDTASSHAAVDLRVDWRSHTGLDDSSWHARGGVAHVTAEAPLALWTGAGSSLDRTALLRGRRLVPDHVVSGEVFGRTLAYGSIERHRPLWRSPYGALALAGFVDVARAFDRLDSVDPSRFHIDAGAGFRVTRPGEANQIRLDWGIGVRDGRMRVSAGYVAAWGRR